MSKMRERFLQNYLAFSENLNFELSKHAKGQLSSLRMTFWCLKFSKKQTQKFDEFLNQNILLYTVSLFYDLTTF